MCHNPSQSGMRGKAGGLRPCATLPDCRPSPFMPTCRDPKRHLETATPDYATVRGGNSTLGASGGLFPLIPRARHLSLFPSCLWQPAPIAVRRFGVNLRNDGTTQRRMRHKSIRRAHHDCNNTNNTINICDQRLSCRTASRNRQTARQRSHLRFQQYHTNRRQPVARQDISDVGVVRRVWGMFAR